MLHTPTPWTTYAQWDGHGVDYYLINPEQDEKSMEEIYANRQLINAAPEMLFTLQAIVDSCTPEQWDGFSQYIQDRILATINKARGEA